jgi:hypothetical protein
MGSRLRRWIAFFLLASVCAASLSAATRSIVAGTPRRAAPGAKLSIPVVASSEVGGGEKIGFFHGEVSLDGGKTWDGFCFEANLPASVTRQAHVQAGSAGTTIMIRVRVAFRGGAAGDVDYTGSAIKWADSWEKWGEPPAKYFRIPVGS